MIIGQLVMHLAPNAAIRRLLEAAPRVMRLAAQTARLMAGIPDYRTYVEHRQRYRRGEVVMSYAEFFRERQAACYAVEKGAFRGIC